MIHRPNLSIVCALCAALAGGADASQSVPLRAGRLRQTSDSIESLVSRVPGSVVQIVVTGYRPREADASHTDVAYGRGRTIGSGVVIDTAGYILTNAHVVAGAERIDVIASAADTGDARSLAGASRFAQARIGAEGGRRRKELALRRSLRTTGVATGCRVRLWQKCDRATQAVRQDVLTSSDCDNEDVAAHGRPAPLRVRRPTLRLDRPMR